MGNLWQGRQEAPPAPGDQGAEAAASPAGPPPEEAAASAEGLLPGPTVVVEQSRTIRSAIATQNVSHRQFVCLSFKKCPSPVL
jgi:hypothetical protein